MYIFIYFWTGVGRRDILYLCVGGAIPPSKKKNYRNWGDSPSLQRTVMSFHFNDKKRLKKKTAVLKTDQNP